MKNGHPFIDLLGVLEDHKEKGIGSCLIRYSETKLFKAGQRKMKVVTQGHNLTALRTYQIREFLIERITIFFHKWID